MAIPTSFKLFGQTVIVSFIPREFTEKDGTYGYSSYRTNEIQLRPSTDTHPLTDGQIEQTFYHELVHFVLYHAGSSYRPSKDRYMHQDEGFVDMCANLLHQAITTMEYEK